MVKIAWLRRLAMVVLALGLSAGVAAAQSLAEIAKKEKERRSKNNEGAGRVITDRELSRGYGSLPASPRDSVSPLTGGADAESESEDDADEVQDETRTREYWQQRVAAAKEKIKGLEQRLTSEDWGEGQMVGVDPRGQRNLTQRAEVEQQLATARSELAGIQDEARRAGVPAGWVR